MSVLWSLSSTFPAAVFVSITALSMFAPPARGQTYSFEAFAGGGLPENIQGKTANLGSVSAVAVDGAGNVYIALPDYSAVMKLDSSGLLTLFAGNGVKGFAGDGGPAKLAQLKQPTWDCLRLVRQRLYRG